MGTDTCGSIRNPASHNSLVGIRGTQGLAGRTGIIPLSSTQDMGGPLGRSVTDIAIMLDTIVGYDPTDPQTAASFGNIPKSYTDSLQLTGLRNARIGLLTSLFEWDPADAEIAAVVRAAINEMKLQGAELVEVTIPGLKELLLDRLNGFLVIMQDFKFDLNTCLAAHPGAPVHSLDEVLASGKVHPIVEPRLRTSQGFESRDTKEYLEHIVKRNTIREAILKAMADNRVDALAYPTIRAGESAGALFIQQCTTAWRLSAVASHHVVLLRYQDAPPLGIAPRYRKYLGIHASSPYLKTRDYSGGEQFLGVSGSFPSHESLHQLAR